MNPLVPPLFTFAGEAFDNDFDINLLSEYLFEDEKQGVPSKGNLQQNPFGDSEFSSFMSGGDEGRKFSL
jgi:hypothetical protein